MYTRRVGDDALARLADAGRRGDVAALREAVTPDVVAICDSGGLIPALVEPVRGVDDVAALLSGFAGAEVAPAQVNGGAGVVVRRGGKVVAVLLAPGEATRIGTLWVVLNPDKLRCWQ
ncbi:MAG: siderophore-interacting protein [Catenulispora sp.]|nr:siderophore-interacting protein [Catenulispora sp.]